MPLRVTRFIAATVAVTCAVGACGSDSDPVAKGSRAAGEASSTSLVASDAPISTTVPTPSTVATTLPPPPPTTVFPPTPRVLLIGDSTLQAVERYDKLHVLLGMDPVYEARSCRLLAVPSCGENPAPNTVEVINTAEGNFDIVVIMAGYDEWYTTFADSFDQVVNSSRVKGARRIIWLSYPEGVDYLLPDGTPGNESLVNINQIMRDKLATGAFTDVAIADWFNYASAMADWFNRDDIHLSPTGATGVADYISRKVAFTASLPCPMPREPGVPVEVPCPDPDISGPLIDVAGLYAT